MVIVDLIGRSNQNALCIFVAKWPIILSERCQGSKEVLWDFGSGFRGDYAGEVNYPSEKFPLGNLSKSARRFFALPSSI
jgi:hypothetical protein